MVKYLALGDSYTIGEGVATESSFPFQLYRDLSKLGVSIVKPNFVAQTGWTTVELIAKLNENTSSPTFDLVTLLIGVNNQYRGLPIEQFEQDFKALTQKAIFFTGGRAKTVLALSIPDYGCTPFGAAKKESIQIEIDQYNEIIKKLSLELGFEYIDITTLSRMYASHPEMLVSDNLHPSSILYRKWVDVLTPIARYALRFSEGDI